MRNLNELWIRYATSRNRKVAYLVLSLIALAVASGAPGAGGGAGGGAGIMSILW